MEGDRGERQGRRNLETSPVQSTASRGRPFLSPVAPPPGHQPRPQAASPAPGPPAPPSHRPRSRSPGPAAQRCSRCWLSARPSRQTASGSGPGGCRTARPLGEASPASPCSVGRPSETHKLSAPGLLNAGLGWGVGVGGWEVKGAGRSPPGPAFTAYLGCVHLLHDHVGLTALADVSLL